MNCLYKMVKGSFCCLMGVMASVLRAFNFCCFGFYALGVLGERRVCRKRVFCLGERGCF